MRVVAMTVIRDEKREQGVLQSQSETAIRTIVTKQIILVKQRRD